MTASEVQGLYDTYRHLRFLGGKVSEENGDEITKKREDSAAIVREGAQARGKKKIVEHERKWRLRDSILADLLYSERDLYGILGYLSRFTEEGPLADILRKVNDASYHEVEMKMDAAKEINRLMKPINFTLKPVWNVRKSITKEDGKPWTLSKRGIFMLALNSGNDSNIGAVLDGMTTNYPEDGAFTERDLYEMVSHLTDVELDAVNGIWAYKDNVLWPEHSAMQKRMTGVTAGKIQAKPFAIRGKRMTGGHFRLHYRWDSKDQGRTAIELDGLDTSRVAMSKSASMIERIGGGGRIVELDMAEHIAADLDNDIRDIAFQELSVEMNAMFMGSENSLVKAISDHYGEKYYKNLVTTLERIVKPPRDKGNRWAPVSKYIRGNMTYAFLAGNVSNIVQNIASVANVYSEVGEKYATLGLLKFYSNPFSHIQEIDKEHPGMANRTALINREAREQLGQIEAVHPVWAAFKNYAMSPQAFFDSLVAYPCYVGAKMQFLDKNRDKYDGSPEGIEKRDKDASDYAMRMVEFSVGSGLAKNLGISVFIVGHVTKDGNIAGPKVLEHMVDCVLSFEGDTNYQFRLLRSLKNRFGAANELGVFSMSSHGMEEVTNPSEIFLEERSQSLIGSAIFASMEGSRPVLCEIQALCAPTPLAMPRRTAIGVDVNRLHMLIAVAIKHLRAEFYKNDVRFLEQF